MPFLSIEQKVGQLFFVGIPGPELDGPTEKLLTEIAPGGVCLFARNIKTGPQTRELLEGIRRMLPVEPFLSIDQEGGRVDRLRRIITPMPAANRFTNRADVEEFARLNSEVLRMLGFNMNFAPVVDVIDDARESATNGLYSRGFGRSPRDVIELSGAFLNELQSGGIIGCLKHFPGLGASSVDSHDELPSVDINMDELAKCDLTPYDNMIASKSAKMVMVAHAAYPSLELQEADQSGRLLPSSLSFHIVTKLLRKKLGFGGVAITDDLEMGAVLKNYGVGEACKMAINAGNDMLAICAKEDAVREGYEAVLHAAHDGAIAKVRIDEAVNRIQVLRTELSAPLPFDADRVSQLSSQIADLDRRLN
jgi:beta-N-acetylhexosaminidase